MIFNNQKGQSLVEVVIALAIAVVIVIAFTNATISSVRNAQFAKDKNQATKHVQEAMEIIRAIRDQDGAVGTDTWNDLWTTNLHGLNAGNNTYRGKCYKLDKTNERYAFTLSLTASNGSCADSADDTLATPFKRKINISDDGSNLSRKAVRVRVYWTDSKGTHNSDITTYLTNWQ